MQQDPVLLNDTISKEIREEYYTSIVEAILN